MGMWIPLISGIVSAAVALTLWWVSQKRDRRAKKAAHTADFLAQLLTNEGLADANLHMSRLIDLGKPVDPTTLDRDSEKYFVRLLNY